jgi:ABC-type Fe3+ transport system permease subunit
MRSSSVSLMTAIVTAIVVFLFAVAWTTAKAARNTYVKTKAGVPAARKLYWSTIGGVVKVGFWAVLLLFLLIAWQVHDVKAVDDHKPTPAPSVSSR